MWCAVVLYSRRDAKYEKTVAVLNKIDFIEVDHEYYYRSDRHRVTTQRQETNVPPYPWECEDIISKETRDPC